jgi:hypothetical protein
MSHDPRFLAETDQYTIIATEGNNFEGFDEIAISKAWAVEIKKTQSKHCEWKIEGCTLVGSESPPIDFMSPYHA